MKVLARVGLSARRCSAPPTSKETASAQEAWRALKTNSRTTRRCPCGSLPEHWVLELEVRWRHTRDLRLLQLAGHCSVPPQHSRSLCLAAPTLKRPRSESEVRVSSALPLLPRHLHPPQIPPPANFLLGLVIFPGRQGGLAGDFFGRGPLSCEITAVLFDAQPVLRVGRVV